ncbi:MAG: hypothetical protein LC721_05180, partial [Actinobacteria bacterium]|nr:hypothetical protein [Actinomycetota bacterium]
MGTSWEFLAGDTSKFALKLSFQDDPHPGVCATTEETASWGTFQLWVEGQNLCSHTEAGETVESVHWYLLPLLEWFALNWDALFHEERLPTRNARVDAASSLQATRFPPRKLDDTPEEGRWFAEWSAWWDRHAIQA